MLEIALAAQAKMLASQALSLELVVVDEDDAALEAEAAALAAGEVAVMICVDRVVGKLR